MKLQPLSQFLNIRHAIIISFLVAIFTSLIVVMNDTGIDDTVEYYIFYEAESLSGFYQPYDEILEFHSGVKEYYWGKEQLPSVYQALFDDRLEQNKMVMFVHERTYVYVLPFALPNAGIDFYVLHIFPFDEYEESNAAFRHNLQIAAVNLAIILILLMIKFNRQITNQIKEFDRWVADISKPNINETQAVPDSIEFRELHEAAGKLQKSMQDQKQMQQLEVQRVKQEKDFLSSLSHELRTPISVIAAAAALLQKRNELTVKDKDIVKKLIKANNNMSLMTKTLLQVWRRQSKDVKPQTVCLADKVEHIIAESSVHFPREVDFELNVLSRDSHILDMTLVELTLDNLLRNASQYTVGEQVKCLVDGNKVTVSNQYDKGFQQEESDHGYGFGLYLVSKICEQENWQFEVLKDNQEFTASVLFNA